jgi:hypothetical protein
LIFNIVRTTGAATLDIFDLVLLPIDETFAEVRSITASGSYFIFPTESAIVSSIEPRRLVKALAQKETTTTEVFEIAGAAQAITPAELSILPAKDQYLIVFPLNQSSGPQMTTRIALYGIPRFYDMRGDL